MTDSGKKGSKSKQVDMGKGVVVLALMVLVIVAVVFVANTPDTFSPGVDMSDPEIVDAQARGTMLVAEAIENVKEEERFREELRLTQAASDAFNAAVIQTTIDASSIKSTQSAIEIGLMQEREHAAIAYEQALNAEAIRQTQAAATSTAVPAGATATAMMIQLDIEKEERAWQSKTAPYRAAVPVVIGVLVVFLICFVIFASIDYYLKMSKIAASKARLFDRGGTRGPLLIEGGVIIDTEHLLGAGVVIDGNDVRVVGSSGDSNIDLKLALTAKMLDAIKETNGQAGSQVAQLAPQQTVTEAEWRPVIKIMKSGDAPQEIVEELDTNMLTGGEE